jgi:hypothetical protein
MPNVVLGTNDDQPLLDEKGQTVNKGTDAWDLEYSKRLGKIMDTFLEHGALRVIWLLQPDMKQAAHQRYADRLNALITAEAGTRPAVLLFDSRAVLCRRPGAPYSATLVGKDGARYSGCGLSIGDVRHLGAECRLEGVRHVGLPRAQPVFVVWG